MAEGLKFWEKTPGRWRLDHPDFKDVHETTYAKGVIQEFQVLQEDPITVASMVKVEIGGKLYGEFVPLFYRPRERHWDGEEVQATDFDPETGAYKQAWMSFRVGDEVVVLLKQGVPQAVLGHYDNCPRLGENVFRLEWDSHPQYPMDPYTHYYSYYCAFGDPAWHWRMARFDHWEEEDIPHGDPGTNREYDWEIPLNRICTKAESKDQLNIYKRTYANTFYDSTDFQLHVGLPPDPPFEGAAIYIRIDYNYDYYRDITYFRVGPILFAHVTNYRIADYVRTIYRGYYYTTEGEGPPPLEEWEWAVVGPVGEFTLPHCGDKLTWDLDEAGVNYESEYGVFLIDWDPRPFEIYAAVCTPELWENPDISKMTRQTDCWPSWGWEWTLADPKSYVFKVPAHTKEDLIEAGWWPETE
uniref:Uncharacterized protein n=1 Tax=Desulfobacca acetoxidans TaxID=60893 RepID=A0A7C3Z9S8_9BACT